MNPALSLKGYNNIIYTNQFDLLQHPCCAPLPIANMLITAATPNMIPNAVSIDFILYEDCLYGNNHIMKVSGKKMYYIHLLDI